MPVARDIFSNISTTDNDIIIQIFIYMHTYIYAIK